MLRVTTSAWQTTVLNRTKCSLTRTYLRTNWEMISSVWTMHSRCQACYSSNWPGKPQSSRSTSREWTPSRWVRSSRMTTEMDASSWLRIWPILTLEANSPTSWARCKEISQIKGCLTSKHPLSLATTLVVETSGEARPTPSPQTGSSSSPTTRSRLTRPSWAQIRINKRFS